tara:strand:- start:41 stop:661 length:621 start_codon:yes stop_codon:yes gene_type:complete
MKPIQHYKTLTILFAPGIGGNHLANMISTSPLVADRVKNILDYKQHLISMYKNSNGKSFHADEFLNFGVDRPDQAYNLIANNTLTTLLPGHIEDGYWVLNHVRSLGKIGFITMEVFDTDLIEFYKDKRDYVGASYNPHLYRFMYNKDVTSRILDISPDDGYAINSAEFLQPDINLLLHKINDELGLELDIDFCNQLNKIRFNKIKS